MSGTSRAFHGFPDLTSFIDNSGFGFQVLDKFGVAGRYDAERGACQVRGVIGDIGQKREYVGRKPGCLVFKYFVEMIFGKS